MTSHRKAAPRRNTAQKEFQVREALRRTVEWENMQRATIMMSPTTIASLWALTVEQKGATHLESLALSEALDWRHREPQRLRDEAERRLKENK